MPKQERRMSSGATAVKESPQPMSSYAATTMPTDSTVRESVRTPATVGPTEREIAAVAYQLWLDNGCPVGWDQEYWFQAEAMLKDALAAKGDDLSRRQSIRRGDTRTEFHWMGHWEVWEMEWGDARWIWDD